MRGRVGPAQLDAALDAALDARARTVLDDKLAHLRLGLEALVDPGDETAHEDLAYLDRR